MSMTSEALLAPGMLAFLGTNSSEPIAEGNGHIVSIALKRMTVVVRVSHPTDQDDRISFGMAQPHAVALPSAGKHHTQHETIHLHVQDRLLAECFDELRRRSPPPLDRDTAGIGGASISDPVVERVGRALRAHDEG